MNENELELTRRQIQLTYQEIQYLIRMLYATTDVYTKNLTLNQLWNKISLLHFLTTLLDQRQTSPLGPPSLPPSTSPTFPSYPQQSTNQTQTTQTTQAPPQNLPPITQEQLARANGRNGNPAYVAVNGIVYDVTNHKAWSAASHFGLPAGKDLTAEFASCHAGQQWILSTMKPVGRLV